DRESQPRDICQATDVQAGGRQVPGARAAGHLAFGVESELALKEAAATLREPDVTIPRTIDHVSQKSIFFNDPDGNVLEIYYELPDALEIFAHGRNDRDVPLDLNR